ncbi:hypothetical protein BB561_006744 [Smittium simulii]|uniref:Probable alpha/beta-glucosidase agdC n=1 Tax=Smittium simulii TaxID=133385 RepID=A0A2T9Y1Y1_9FUNG|nr:hypothetical protein BB561_006744 [Smittium simulii]
MKVSTLLFSISSLVASASAAAYPVSKATCPGYKKASYPQVENGVYSVELTLAGPPCNIYGNDIKDLKLSITNTKGNNIRILIEDKDKKQYQISDDIVVVNRNPKNNNFADLEINHTVDPKTGFGFKITRGDEVIFDTTGHPLIFEDQYLELTSSIADNANIYGMGESADYFRRDSNNSTKTLWARDAATPLKENVYGAHSIYMEKRNGKFHGAYLHNSHGMDIVLANNTIQYRVLGGVIDLNVFGGPSAYDVINAYTELVGRPHPLPYWTLGLHNCRYGYKSIDEVNQVIANYSSAGIPLETMWIDIDYMDRTKDFTFDPVNFPINRVQETLRDLRKNKQKMVMMTDPAIQRNSSYAPFARGLAKDAFIKNADGSLYVGQVWPGYTTFPDWFAPNTEEWWHNELDLYFNNIDLDGMWIDMNEAASFCTGSCGSGISEDVIPPFPWKVDPPVPHRNISKDNTFLVPKYSINNPQTELSDKGIETTAVHANGLIDYHVHNLYGHMMAQTTRKFLDKHRPNVRPFLLTRSTFAGTGAYASHWNGDNGSDWQNLHISIPSMLDFGIFGIPFVGSDICGFFGNSTEQLCARWIEVGAFYPFSRVHNGIDSSPQELYRWPVVAEASRRVLNVRYQLLPYYYTYHSKSTISGHPVARPLVFEFPQDSNTNDIDKQFMIGEGILISPVVAENATTVEAYLPKGIWYDWYDHKGIMSQGRNYTLEAPIEHVNVHIKGGSIISTQEARMTVEESRASDFTLIVALDENSKASGDLYLDDGLTYNTSHTTINFSYDNKKLTSKGTYNYKEHTSICKIIILSYIKDKSETLVVVKENIKLDLNSSWSIEI